MKVNFSSGDWCSVGADNVVIIGEGRGSVEAKEVVHGCLVRGICVHSRFWDARSKSMGARSKSLMSFI